jgi:hypothetical protein
MEGGEKKNGRAWVRPRRAGAEHRAMRDARRKRERGEGDARRCESRMRNAFLLDE